jgi:hypothetical protein
LEAEAWPVFDSQLIAEEKMSIRSRFMPVGGGTIGKANKEVGFRVKATAGLHEDPRVVRVVSGNDREDSAFHHEDSIHW